MAAVAGAESIGTGEVSRKVLIADLSDFENRKQEIAEQLHYAASEVGFVSLSILQQHIWIDSQSENCAGACKRWLNLTISVCTLESPDLEL